MMANCVTVAQLLRQSKFIENIFFQLFTFSSDVFAGGSKRKYIDTKNNLPQIVQKIVNKKDKFSCFLCFVIFIDCKKITALI